MFHDREDKLQSGYLDVPCFQDGRDKIALNKAANWIALAQSRNSHCETDFGVFSAFGARNTKIVFFESPPTAGFQKKRFL